MPLSIIASIISIITGLAGFISIELAVIIVGFIVLITLYADISLRLRNQEKILKLFKNIVDLSIKALIDINKDIARRNGEKPITWKELHTVFFW